MKHRALLIVRSDPDTDQAVEALRIAAGIGSWQKVEVTVCLRDRAAALVHPDTLSISRDLASYVDQITRPGRPILIQTTTQPGGEAPPNAQCRRVDSAELARLAARSDSVLVY